MNITHEQLNNALRAVQKRAAADIDFRAKCLNAPVEAIKEAGGLDLPPTAKIRFVEQSDETVILLPAFNPEGEISDEKTLQGISGGGNLFKYM